MICGINFFEGTWVIWSKRKDKPGSFPQELQRCANGIPKLLSYRRSLGSLGRFFFINLLSAINHSVSTQPGPDAAQYSNRF